MQRLRAAHGQKSAPGRTTLKTTTHRKISLLKEVGTVSKMHSSMLPDRGSFGGFVLQLSLHGLCQNQSKSIAKSNQNNKKSNDSWSSVCSKLPSCIVRNFLHYIFCLYHWCFNFLNEAIPEMYHRTKTHTWNISQDQKPYLKYITGPCFQPSLWICQVFHVSLMKVGWESLLCSEVPSALGTEVGIAQDPLECQSGSRKCGCHHILTSVTFMCTYFAFE